MPIEFQSQCDSTIQEITDIVREFCIETQYSLITRKISIFSDRKCREEIECEHIPRVLGYILYWIDHIADRLGHLLSIDCEVSCREELMRCLISCRPEHRRPIYPMESDDILADHVHICWPPPSLIILHYCEVVEQRIIPDIGHLCSVEWERNPELVRLTRYREVLESTTDELDDLIVSRSRFYEVWIFFIEF